MSEASERTVWASGLAHHVLTWNEAGAPSAVLCHGFLDQAWSFDPLARRLVEDGLRVVAFDWRGHGETEHVGPGGYYHFMDYLRDLHELLPQLAEGEVHLLGHSMGATAAALYAGTHPGALASLTLIEGLGPPGTASSPVDKAVTWLRSLDRVASRPPGPVADLADAIRRMRAQNPDLPDELAHFLAEKATVVGPDGARRWRFDPLHRTTSPGVFSPDAFMTFLGRIDAPTLVVSGSEGFRTSDHATRLAALPDAREEVVAGAGHMIHWQAPGPLATLFSAHVRRLGQGAASM